MPDDYLPELRKAGYTGKFTRLMLETALVELERCRELPDGFKVCINIFPADIISGELQDIISMEEIRRSRFSPTLEITEEEPIRSSLIPHIINMADQLGMTVIAEGIETFAQQVILVGLGIQYGQGGYFGPPMPLPDLLNQLKNRNQASPAHAVILDS